METNCTYLPYHQTNYFSDIAIDYVNADKKLQPFYNYPVSIEGIKQSIGARNLFPQQREVLVRELKDQYEGIPQPVKVSENIQSLLRPNTFTITTAHQPNIFTGPLYFIYKLLHIIKIADELNKQLTQYYFVPVYYMGSEDADLDEVGSIVIDGVHYAWQTKQTGAVGRMKVDKAFISMIDAMYGQLGVLPYGDEIIQLFKKVYTVGKTIQQAALELVNHLFGKYGLVTILPDNTNLKKLFQQAMEKELTERFSNQAVGVTLTELEKNYKIQAGGRELNLFYLIDDKRERIEVEDLKFKVLSLKLEWTEEEILKELHEHPERFSPNVILRGAFQETILPNIAFVGGGGELAYWLELKNVFASINVPYPLLVLRNSFLLVDEKYEQMVQNLGLQLEDIFHPEHELMNKIVTNRTENKVRLNGELQKIENLYNEVMNLASNVDLTLKEHVAALKTKAVSRLQELEKKMLRAEKRKYNAELNQLQKIKSVLFPHNGLQERTENISGFYAKHGRELIDILLENSTAFNQEFGILSLHT
ncbi:MAG TPA: bacillithiol biosynthesis cysteine-adding enzyme BshC [Chitinophagaceae bacterium]|jgi:bacillithiol biosynthesis cysteine-adding enzyme BshC